MPLLAVPNVSEGRDPQRIATLEEAFGSGATLLDRHFDADHNRSVFTIAGSRDSILEALARGAEEAIRAIDVTAHEGAHPRIGALDVCPVVWLEEGDRAAARAAALEVAERIGGLGVPVFLYGDLATEPGHAERAYFRSGGLEGLERRMKSGELRPDRGPDLPHPTAGATLVTARPPLAAFNVELESGDVDVARAVADSLREAGGGPAGVRALGLELSSGRVQVSTNVHDPIAVPLGDVVELIRELAEAFDVQPVEAELIGLVPRAALRDYPADVPIRGFERERHVIEERLSALA